MSKEHGERIMGLIAAGVLLSNAAFNLSQRSGRSYLDAEDIASLKDAYARWDRANRIAWESGAMQALTELPAVFDPVLMGA